MTGHPLDLRVVDGVGRELVVGAQELEHSGAAKNQVWLVGGRRRADLPKHQRQHPQGNPQGQTSQLLVTLNDGLGCH